MQACCGVQVCEGVYPLQACSTETCRSLGQWCRSTYGRHAGNLQNCRALSGGRLDVYKKIYIHIYIYIHRVWMPPGHPPNPPPRVRNRPPGAGNEVHRPSRTIPGSTQKRRTRTKNKKHPQTSSTPPKSHCCGNTRLVRVVSRQFSQNVLYNNYQRCNWVDPQSRKLVNYGNLS